MKTKVQERIVQYVNDQEIKKSRIARKSGIDNAALTRIFQGKRELRADEFEQICKALGKSPSNFMKYR